VTGFLDGCAPDGREGTLTEAVKRAEGLKKGLCFLITDGYTEDALKEALDYLRYRRQETAVIQVLSGGELRPEMEGALRLTDSESGERIDLLADRAAMDAYHGALEDFLKKIRENCAAREAPYMLLDGEKAFEECFIPLLSKSRMI
jgi:hypothetical protein